MTGFIAGHGVYVKGRWYEHQASPVKKADADDQTLLKIHRGQKDPFYAKARYRTIVAGRRWGKTHMVVIEMILAAASKSKQKVWYVAPTYTMAKQIAWEKLKEIVPRSWLAKAPNETALTIRLKNGSTISLKGADRPDSVRGVGIHFLCLDEFQDMKWEIWTAIRPTLSDTRGRAMFIGTPKAYNHLYDFYERGQSKELQWSQWQSWQFKTLDSPFIPPSEIAQARNDMDAKTFRQEYEANFESMAGRVYYAFNRHVNVRPCPYDPSIPTLVGQDFNIDPMSSAIMQRHGDELWVTGEQSLRTASTEDVCRELLHEYGWGFKDKATIYPDPAGGNRSSARGESDVQIFREWGFKRLLYHRKHPLVRDRVAAVNRMLSDANGVSRLYIDPSCEQLIRCFEQLIFDDKGEPDKSMNIEHIGDAAGYAIQYEYPVRRKFEVKGYSH